MSAGMGIGMGASAIGSILQGIAAIQDRNAMENAYKNQMATQDAWRGEAQGLFKPQMSSAEAMTQGVQEGAQQRMAGYNSLGATPLAPGRQPGGLTGKSDNAWSNLTGNLRAKVGGYSDWAVQQAIQNLKTQESLNRVINFAGGQSRLLPLQMYDAQHKGDGLAAIGQGIASIGGSTANYMGLLGNPPVGGGTPSYYPMGTSYPGYSMSPAYSDAYGNFWPQGANTLSTGLTPG